MRALATLFIFSIFSGSGFGETSFTGNQGGIQTTGTLLAMQNRTVIMDRTGFSEKVVKGSGNPATENRELDTFTQVDLCISADVTIKAGKKRRCTITTDDNLLPLIRTECEGQVLKIFAKENYSSKLNLTVAIETPLITAAEISGSGNIDIEEVTDETLTLIISGSGDITAKGKVKNLIGTIEGAGDLDVAELKAETAVITIEGAGDADVYVTKALTAEICGSGEITYSGLPPEVNASVTGAGDVIKK